MNSDKGPADRLLDLLVYAPAGLLLTAVEELPRLADKGRERVEARIGTARMVGQFAVQFGKAELDKRLAGARRPGGEVPGTAPGPAPASDQAASDQAASDGVAAADRAAGPAPTPTARPDRRGADEGDRAREAATGRAPVAEPAPAPRTRTAAAPDPAAPGVSTNGHGAAAPAADELGIPGYDTLSASQVVQRLAGLSEDELAAVGHYEATHRHRRTILNRVGQLSGARG